MNPSRSRRFHASTWRSRTLRISVAAGFAGFFCLAAASGTAITASKIARAAFKCLDIVPPGPFVAPLSQHSAAFVNMRVLGIKSVPYVAWQSPIRSNSACDLCGSTSARELYTARDRLGNSDERFSIVQCEGCGILRTLPEMSSAELASFYPDDYWGDRVEPTQEWIESSQSEKTRFLSRSGLRGGRILDVGCGSGFFLRALDSSQWDRFGVETGTSAATAAERAIGNGRVFKGTLIGSRWADSTFDVATFWSALEHTNEPRANLREARRIIKDDGSLIVQLPNATSCQSRFFGGDWFALD